MAATQTITTNRPLQLPLEDCLAWTLLITVTVAWWLAPSPLSLLLAPLLQLGFVIFALFRRNRVSLCYTLLLLSIGFAREVYPSLVEFDLIPIIGLIFALLLTAPPSAYIDRYLLGFIVPIACYLGWSILSGWLFSADVTRSLRQTFVLGFRVISFGLIVAVIRQYSWGMGQTLKAIRALLLLNFVICVFAIALAPFVRTPFIVQRIQYGTSALGTFQEPNVLGIFAFSMGCIFFCYYLFNWTLQSARTARWLFPVIGILLLVSYTRSTWVGLIVIGCIVSVCVFLFSQRAVQRRLLIIGGVGLLTVTVLLIGIVAAARLGDSSYAQGLLTRMGEVVDRNSTSFAGRSAVWEIALERWSNNRWIGYGFLTHPATPWSRQGWVYNFVVQSLHDTGLIGTAFLTWFYSACLLRVLWVYRTATSSAARGIMLGMLAAQLAILLTSITSNLTWSAFAWAITAFGVGYSWRIVNRQA